MAGDYRTEMPQEETRERDEVRVLVVDDDRSISRLIRQNLEGQGTTVIEAASGLECISKLQQSRVDLILLDVGLPDYNGWGVLSLVRLTESLHDMPVIVISEDPPSPALIERLRPDDYIQKPFDMRDLLLRVRRVTRARKKATDGPGREPGSAHRASN